MTWQFWLDVGGTFTDCLARAPDGRLLKRKVLSSGITKSQAGAGSTANVIVDPTRTEPDGFWIGYKLQLLDERGAIAAYSDVSDFQRSQGALGLTPQLFDVRAGHLLPADEVLAHSYELVSPEEAPILAIRLFLSLRLDEPIPPCSVRLGTTRGTNALLTRRGAKTGFVTTRGFGDVLRIGYQNRPKLFELAIKKPEPLFAATIEIDERVAADGSVLQAPSEAQI